MATLAIPTSVAREFGYSVAICGNTVVVGAQGAGGGDPGAAYIFDAGTGALLFTLADPRGGLVRRSVSISGTTVVVGAPGDWSGEAFYLFDSTTGDLLRKVVNPRPAGNDEFGYSVAISGNTVAAGRRETTAAQPMPAWRTSSTPPPAIS